MPELADHQIVIPVSIGLRNYFADGGKPGVVIPPSYMDTGEDRDGVFLPHRQVPAAQGEIALRGLLLDANGIGPAQMTITEPGVPVAYDSPYTIQRAQGIITRLGTSGE